MADKLPNNSESKQTTKRENELEMALIIAQDRLSNRTLKMLRVKTALKSIKETRMFTLYLIVRTLILLPIRAISMVKRKFHGILMAIFITDAQRRFLVKVTRSLRKFMGQSSNTKNTRAFVDYLDAKRKQQYHKWYLNNWPSQQELERQKDESESWKKRPLISLVMPTYNTPEEFLRDVIESVQSQSYQNWELCIADDASKESAVRQIITEYGKSDSRIKYVFRKKNGHISEASNSALQLATGEFVGLLDHDDILWPNALYENVKAINQNSKVDLIYSDEDKVSENGKIHEDPYFKPDWSPDQLRCHNYITHFSVIRKSLMESVGGFRVGFEGAQDWDLLLRVSREARSIHHIPTVLYSWRKARTSTALRADAKDYAWKVQRHVLVDDISARGLIGDVSVTSLLGLWQVKYQTPSMPKISIIIPTKNQYELIKQCLDSIVNLATYTNYELIIIDTGSEDERVSDLYQNPKYQPIRVEKWNKPFNYASVCNWGASISTGKYLLFLNNDTEVISPNFIEALLGYAQQDHVGAVGCKLLYPNDHIQHAGIVLGLGGFPDTPAVAGHIFAGWNNNLQDQYKIILTETIRDSSAVTGACLMVKKSKFDKVGGFDESFKIAYNDVDLCLKLRDKGLYNVYLSTIQLYHHESVSVGRAGGEGRDIASFKNEHRRMAKKWGKDAFANDPFFNPHYKVVDGCIEIRTS